ncbi:hypothetical protein [Leclercia sp.]|uniref:hypothetical protein n=1 Tax=Leclercia sp. TaxID=1898428 RepID=UPI002FDCC61F
MQGFKEFLESLQKMTDVRLNIAILVTCLVLILISPADHFILDPVPKLIPQSLILITTTRLVFSLINLIHSFLSRKIEKEQERKKSDIANQEKLKMNAIMRDNVREEFKKLDIFQLYIVKTLIGKNHCSHSKGAALFSLCNAKITYVVASGEHTQSLSLTAVAADILEKEYSNDTSALEINAATRVFNSMPEKELAKFKLLLERDVIKTTWFGHDRRSHFAPSHATFGEYKKSIIFEQPQEGFEYSLNPLLRDVLSNY